METTHAREILKSLADGRDPVTGAPFPRDSAYQQADTVRALYVALEALDQPAGKPKRPADPNRPQVGRPWTPEEEQKLRDAFTTHKPIPEIAATHGRTPGAVTSRLVRLGLIQDDFSHPAHRPATPPARQPPDRPAGPPTTKGNPSDEPLPF